MMVIIKIRLGLESMTRSYFKLNRIPFAVKLYIGFALLVFLLMGITYLHAYIKRPEQMQSLQLYEQKLETISSNKVNEEYYLGIGEHAAIVKKNILGKYKYLELQDSELKENKYNSLVKEELKRRFGCDNNRYGMTVLIRIKTLLENEEFIKILGYLNTEI